MILKNKSLLGLLAKIASKISGDWQDRLLTFYNKHVVREVPSIIHCLNYPLRSEFDSLPSGCHFRVGISVGPKDSRFLLFVLQPVFLMANSHFVAFYCCCFYSHFIVFIFIYWDFILLLCTHWVCVCRPCCPCC